MPHSDTPSALPVHARGLPAPLDLIALARQSGALGGTAQLAELARVAESDVLEFIEPLHWNARAWMERDATGRLQPWLTLTLECVPMLPCARCLNAVTAESVRVERRFRIVADESRAAREDAEEMDIEVIAVQGSFDLAGLIEDELILSLPMRVAHEVCPD